METNKRTSSDNDEKITKEIGRIIAQARKNKGITQAELAKRLSLTQAMICTYENGARRIPITKFIKIAQAIGVSPGKLLDGFEEFKKGDNGRHSRRFLKRLEEIEKLPEFEKRTLVKTIDAILFQYKERQKSTS